MSPMHYSKWYAGCLAVCAAGVALPARAQIVDNFGGDPSTNAFIRIPKDTDDWIRHFRLGAMLGLNIKARFAMSGNFGVSGSDAATGNYGTGNYVKPDASGDTTYTANWGYSSSSEISTVGGVPTLTMSAVNSFSAAGNSSADGGFQPGFDMAYGDNLWYWRHARVGWELGFGWLPIDIGSHTTMTGTVNSTDYNFDLSGLGVIPAAPYTGAANGVGPLIPLKPESEVNLPGLMGTVSGTHSLDVSLYTLRLGPSFYWDVSRRVGMSLGAGPAVGLVNGEYKYNESITYNGTTAQNSGDVSGTGVVYGGYVNATLMYHLVNNGDIYLGAQYMPMTDTTISGAGRAGTLDLGGQLYFSLGINWPF